MYNSSTRDFCGDEAAVSKLSNHFTKNLTFNERFQTNEAPNLQYIQSSFHMNDLINDINERSDSSHVSNVKVPYKESSPQKCSSTGNTVNRKPLQHNWLPPYGGVPNYNVPTNPLSSCFRPPSATNIAKVWAESELSRFEDKVISCDEFRRMVDEANNESNIRFSDVVRQIAADEEEDDAAVGARLSSEVHADEFLTQIDRDLKDMRERLEIDGTSDDVWRQIDNSLKEKVQQRTVSELLFNATNPHLDFLRQQLGFATEDREENTAAEDGLVQQSLERGLALFKQGLFSEASLVFEAVVQLRQSCEEGWAHLALCYSENEQDDKATLACNSCLRLNPNNREVLLSLARIYCNEMGTEAAIVCLERWLLAHPRYCHLATVGQEAIYQTSQQPLTAENSLWNDYIGDISDAMYQSSGKYQILEQQLQSARTEIGSTIDPELELVTGTLYHSVQDYERAANHFERALTEVKDQPQLWNKLGTAYCNQAKYDKAIEAYHRALELAPGFARAECNLGVAYYNMDQFESSIRHGLRAHKMQHSQSKVGDTVAISTVPDESLGSNPDAEPIWTLIRLASFKLNRPDLDLVIFSRDADTLMREFGVE